MPARLMAWHRNVIEPGMGEHIQVHIAEFDRPTSRQNIINQNLCPKLFSFLIDEEGVQNSRYICYNRDIQQIPDTPQAYKVRCLFTTKWDQQPNDGKFSFIENPLQRPALITWGTYVVREAVEIDLLGQPIVTSAGEPFLLEEEYHRRTITIEKNVREIPPIFATETDWVNSDRTLIGGIRFNRFSLLLVDVSVGYLTFENGVYYYPLTLRMFHNPKDWYRRPRNAGYYMKSWTKKKKEDGTEYFPLIPIVFSSTGQKADHPILLDSKGRPIQSVFRGWNQKGPLPDPARDEPIYDIQSPDEFNRAFTEEELAESKLFFKTRPLLNFTNELPIE
jgi:hypothetical protein